MLGSAVLDVAIGIVFIFVLVSIVCSAIREGIEAFLKTRASHLEWGVRQLLNDPHGSGLTQQLFRHPLIDGLFDGGYSPTPQWRYYPTAFTRGRNLPSYIPSRNFALALMDMAARGPDVNAVSSHPAAGALTFDEVRANVARIDNPYIQRVLLVALDSAQGDLQKAQDNLAAWFDSSMDRVSGWYKRSTQWILFATGLVVAWSMNIDPLELGRYLYQHEAARDILVSAAGTASADSGFLAQSYAEARTALASTLPIGWDQRSGSPFGYLLTAFAATLGAPFWFDLLNKVMVIRSTVKPHEKSPEEASEDRQIHGRVAPGRNGTSTAAPTDSDAEGRAALAAAAPPVAAPMRSAGARAASVPADPDEIDGCDVEMRDFTRDEELPEARGGVA